MNNNFDNKNNSNKYAWNDAMILDKIQEILQDKNIDDLQLTEEELENIKTQLKETISDDELNDSGYVIAENIDELKSLPKEDIKEYISKLIDYLNNTNIKGLIGEVNGIEFEVFATSTVEDVFKDYYSRYDEAYGISEMLSDLGLK